jgi:hypothetical protein
VKYAFQSEKLCDLDFIQAESVAFHNRIIVQLIAIVSIFIPHDNLINTLCSYFLIGLLNVSLVSSTIQEVMANQIADSVIPKLTFVS